MSSCSSGCKCGSDCKCGDNCGCEMYPDLGATETIVAGVAPVKMFYESFGAENDCKCGSNCSCDGCTCDGCAH